MGTAAALAPVHERAERVCLALARSELEVAFSYLRLAEAEVHGGKVAHALDLIDKARKNHAAALRYIETLPVEFDCERGELQSDARELFDAIRRAGSFLLTSAS